MHIHILSETSHSLGVNPLFVFCILPQLHTALTDTRGSLSAPFTFVEKQAFCVERAPAFPAWSSRAVYSSRTAYKLFPLACSFCSLSPTISNTSISSYNLEKGREGASPLFARCSPGSIWRVRTPPGFWASVFSSTMTFLL